MTAGICVASAWSTLVISIIGAVLMVMAGMGVGQLGGSALPLPSGSFNAPGLSSLNAPGAGQYGMDGTDDGMGGSPLGGMGSGSPGLGDLGLPGSGPSGGVGDLFMGPLRAGLSKLFYGSAAFTLVTGIVMWVLFLGLGQVCYVLLDLEEQNIQMQESLGIIVARLGSGR